MAIAHDDGARRDFAGNPEHVRLLAAHVEQRGLQLDARMGSWAHMGAVIVDAALQPGMSYSTVAARARKIRDAWPDAVTLSRGRVLGGRRRAVPAPLSRLRCPGSAVPAPLSRLRCPGSAVPAPLCRQRGASPLSVPPAIPTTMSTGGSLESSGNTAVLMGLALVSAAIGEPSKHSPNSSSGVYVWVDGPDPDATVLYIGQAGGQGFGCFAASVRSAMLEGHTSTAGRAGSSQRSPWARTSYSCSRRALCCCSPGTRRRPTCWQRRRLPSRSPRPRRCDDRRVASPDRRGGLASRGANQGAYPLGDRRSRASRSVDPGRRARAAHPAPGEPRPVDVPGAGRPRRRVARPTGTCRLRARCALLYRGPAGPQPGPRRVA